MAVYKTFKENQEEGNVIHKKIFLRFCSLCSPLKFSQKYRTKEAKWILFIKMLHKVCVDVHTPFQNSLTERKRVSMIKLSEGVDYWWE